MSNHVAFRRQPVQPQMALQHQAITMPAPNRGIIESENIAFMQPGAAMICDNWVPTMRGVRLRGGCLEWCTLPETTPIISGFEYVSGSNHRMYAANANKLYDVTAPSPALVASGQSSGNYSTAQMANAAGDYLIAVNEAGDFPWRFDGTTWVRLNADQIGTDPVKYPGAKVEHGHNLVYVWKYRNRLFFIEQSSMNAWYLGLNSIGGKLEMIPLSGAATRGGRLVFGCSWSIDAGDGIDDKCCFFTDLGEVIIFTGGNPADPANWRQEGRYQIGQPLGINAHIAIGGDVLIATTDGIVPLSKAITKDAIELQLAAVTMPINNMWRQEVAAKRGLPWTMTKWDDYGAMFVTWPGGRPGNRYCAVMNVVTNAWARFTGWDATCWMHLRQDMFFGTQDGIVMQADRTGMDNGLPYVATLVGGWGLFGKQAQSQTWLQARAIFAARGSAGSFIPQITSCVDYVIDLPPPPLAGVDNDVIEVWDQGQWDSARWDQPTPGAAPIRNTGWISVGRTGFSHAPVIQVTVAQQSRPAIEFIAMDALFSRIGTDV